MKYIDIDELIEILRNFDIIDCEFKNCDECELNGKYCDMLCEISDVLKEKTFKKNCFKYFLKQRR